MYKRVVEAYKVTLEVIHNNTIGVDMRGELNEQQIIFEYLPREGNVLELGGNIGRSSIIISNLLNRPMNHVVVEPDPNIAAKLKSNRDKKRGLHRHGSTFLTVS